MLIRYALLFGLLLFPAELYAQQAPALALGVSVTDSLSAGTTRTFTVETPAGYFVYGEADQQTVDVVVAITGPKGEAIGTFDVTARSIESFQFEAKDAGVYRLVVSPYEGR